MTFLTTPALAVEDDETDDILEYIDEEFDYIAEETQQPEPAPEPVTMQLTGAELLELLEALANESDFDITDSFIPFTPSGNGTVVDNATDNDGKEFFTIMTEAGNILYLIIDRQRSTENVYFLSTVTEQDLIDLAAEDGIIISGSSSTIPIEPLPPEDEEEPDTQVNNEPVSDNNILLYIIIAAVIGVGIVAYYFKVIKAKKDTQEDDDFYDDDNFDNNDFDDSDISDDDIEDGDR
jgi:hypothetical protein